MNTILKFALTPGLLMMATALGAGLDCNGGAATLGASSWYLDCQGACAAPNPACRERSGQVGDKLAKSCGCAGQQEPNACCGVVLVQSVPGASFNPDKNGSCTGTCGTGGNCALIFYSPSFVASYCQG